MEYLSMKKAVAAVIVVLSLSACSSKSTAPMPTHELTSMGQSSSKGGSYDAAFDVASEFCDRWSAVPSVVSKVVLYQGELEEETQVAANVVSDIARIAGKGIFSLGSHDAYETKLKYKCY